MRARQRQPATPAAAAAHPTGLQELTGLTRFMHRRHSAFGASPCAQQREASKPLQLATPGIFNPLSKPNATEG